MLKKIKDAEFTFKFIYIAGISNVKTSFNKIQDKLDKICKDHKVIIQFFNSQLIGGWEHLFFSSIHSLKAFKQGVNISNKLELEILLYSSGQHQIKVAIKKFGIDLETPNIAFIILGNTIDSIENAKLKVLELIKGTEDISILDIDENKFKNLCHIFNVSDLELKTVSNSNKWDDQVDGLKKIILNRIAFLVFEK